MHQFLGVCETLSDKQLTTFADIIKINVEQMCTELQEYLQMPERKNLWGEFQCSIIDIVVLTEKICKEMFLIYISANSKHLVHVKYV